MMGDARGTVERGLALGKLSRRPEAGVRIGPRVQQRGGGTQKAGRAFGFEAQVLGEPEVVQGVAAVRRARRGCAVRILRQQPLHGPVIAEDGGGMDIAASELWMLRQQGLGLVQRAVPRGRLDEFGAQIFHGNITSTHLHQPSPTFTILPYLSTSSPSRACDSICRFTMS